MVLKFAKQATAQAEVKSSLSDELNKARSSKERLDKVTDKLNEKFTKVEAQIAALKLGVSGRVLIGSRDDGFERWLGFVKLNDQWRLVSEEGHAASDELSDTVPLVNAPRSVRLLAVGHLRRLVTAMLRNVDKEVAAVEEGLKGADEFLKDLAAASEPTPAPIASEDAPF